VRGHKFLFLLFALTGCGGSNDTTDPRAIEALNQACISEQISGEFVVKTKAGKFQKITAASKKHLFQRIKKIGIKAQSYEPNFKITNRPIAKPLDAETESSLSEGPKLLNADFMWDNGFKGSGAVTALIDSGYDFSHSLLQGSVFENEDELGNDEDQNGFKNDRFGWDTFNNRPLAGDLGRHGTQVGSVIAARHTDTLRISMAPESKIVPIAALQADESGDTDASGDSNSITNAIDYAISRKVDFINASWGGDTCSTFIKERIKLATDLGIIFVTSAGNEATDIDQTVAFPASLSLPSILTVGGVNLDGSREENSNFGQIVDFTAMGKDVVVASPHNQLGSVTGTSAAAPFITGGLALLKNAFPEASSEALIRALEESKNDQKIPDLKVAFSILKEL